MFVKDSVTGESGNITGSKYFSYTLIVASDRLREIVHCQLVHTPIVRHNRLTDQLFTGLELHIHGLL